MASSRSGVVFASIIGGALILAYLAVGVLKLSVPLAAGLAVALILGSRLLPDVQVVREFERVVIFTFGRFDYVQGPGVNVHFPLWQSAQLVDLREHTVDTPPQEVITRDNVKVKVNPVAYVKITDPRKSVIEARDLNKTVSNLLVATLRDKISKMTYTEVVENAESINEELIQSLQQVENEYGIKAVRVELINIDLPATLIDAMKKRKEAEENKARTQIDAEARQVNLEILNRATSQFSNQTLAFLYLETLNKMSEGRSSKILLPLEFTRLAQQLAGRLGNSPLPALTKLPSVQLAPAPPENLETASDETAFVVPETLTPQASQTQGGDEALLASLEEQAQNRGLDLDALARRYLENRGKGG